MNPIKLVFCGRLKSVAAVCLIFLVASGISNASPKSEIESLIAYVGNLNGATFLRNGGAHPAKDAEAHLRMKWGKAGSRVKSAEDFIKLCATKSYLSGKVYKIRFKDGTEKACADVLMAKLEAIRVTP